MQVATVQIIGAVHITYRPDCLSQLDMSTTREIKIKRVALGIKFNTTLMRNCSLRIGKKQVNKVIAFILIAINIDRTDKPKGKKQTRKLRTEVQLCINKTNNR
jgi:hypothetical protein